MANTLLKADLVGVTNGSNLTTSTAGPGDTVPSAILGVTPTVDQTNAVLGGALIDVIQTTGNQSMTTWALAGGAVAVADIGYIVEIPAAFTSTAFVLFQGLSGATPKFRNNIAGTGAPGEIRLCNGASTAIGATSGNGIVAVSTKYWCVVSVNLAAVPTQQIQLKVYNMAGTLLYDTTTRTDSSIGTTFDHISLGNPVTTPVTGAMKFGRPYVMDTVGALGAFPPNLLSVPVAPSGSGTTTTVETVAFAVTEAPAGTGTLSVQIPNAYSAFPAPSGAGTLSVTNDAMTVTGVAPAPAGSGLVVNDTFQGWNDYDTVGRIPYDTLSNQPVPTTGAGFLLKGAPYRITTSNAVREQVSASTFGAIRGYGSAKVRFRFPGALPTTANSGGTDFSVLYTINSTLIGGAGQGHFQTFFRPSDNRLCADLLATNALVFPTPLVADQYYLLQVRWFYNDTSYWAELALDGRLYGRITSTGLPPYFNKAIGLGTPGLTQTYDMDVDDFEFAVSNQLLPFLGPPVNVLTSTGTGTTTVAKTVAFAVPEAPAGSGSTTDVVTAGFSATVAAAGSGSTTLASGSAVAASGTGTTTVSSLVAVAVTESPAGTGLVTTIERVVFSATEGPAGSGQATVVVTSTFASSPTGGGSGTTTTAELVGFIAVVAPSGSGSTSITVIVSNIVNPAGSGQLTVLTHVGFLVAVAASGVGRLTIKFAPRFLLPLENQVTDAMLAMLKANMPANVKGYDHVAPPTGRNFPYYIVYRIPGGSYSGPELYDPYADAVLMYQIDAVAKRRDQAELVGSQIRQIILGFEDGSPKYQLVLPPNIAECGRLGEVPGGVQPEGDFPHTVYTFPGRYEVAVTPTGS